MATYYVGTGGSDAADGLSWANRKLTLNGAEDIPVAAGDTVYVGPGTYRETLTCDVSGTAGNPITYIGDYTGANTDGTGGVVRITGSNNDTTATRTNCVIASSINYRTFAGFAMDIASGYGVQPTNGTNWIIEDCTYQGGYGFASINGASTNCTIRRCFIFTTSVPGGRAIIFQDSGAGDQSDTGNIVENCVIMTGPSTDGVESSSIGGITVRNCIITGAGRGIDAASLAAGQTVTVNNCVFYACTTGVYAGASGEVTEDYNAFFGCNTNRTNTTTGANSNTYPLLADPRWLFEATRNGGTLVTPFDLASYSALVELNSGTGAPAADMRGTTVQGTFREWGPLEYDSTLDIEAGAAPGASVYRRVARILGG